jgi:hypothetical protein
VSARARPGAGYGNLGRSIAQRVGRTVVGRFWAGVPGRSAALVTAGHPRHSLPQDPLPGSLIPSASIVGPVYDQAGPAPAVSRVMP